MKTKSIIFPMRLITLLVILMLNSFNTYAQAGQSTKEGIDGPLTDMYVVLGAGAAGAVLGLSTLSFVDEPTKSFRNVSMGAAIGIIMGVGIVVYNQATRASSEIYGFKPNLNDNPLKYDSEIRQEFAMTSEFDQYRKPEWINYSFSF
jgi:hypothetical protein